MHPAITKITGLFIDDGRLAIAIAAWVGVVSLLPFYTPPAPLWLCITFVAGLALIFIISTTRRARMTRRTPGG